MSQQPANADPSLEEQLVAYLDGELDTEASRRVEELLASDAKVRQTLQGLDRTWELLDQLETPQVAESFTRSTLEMVTVAAAEDTERSRTETSRRWRRRWVIAGGSLLAAGVAGFLVFLAVWKLTLDPNRQLVDDLPVLENLDEYRQHGQVVDIEFLQTLHEQDLFAEEDGDEQ
jgi:anti-sigma factor RsiW